MKGDALLASLRARLRREQGFPREAGRPFGVEAIYSEEPMGGTRGAGGAADLSCAGYGSLVTVTAAMGLAVAARVLELARSAPASRPARQGP